MRIHLIKKNTIESFAFKHPDAATGLNTWISRLQKADWNIPGNISETFNSADLLGNSSDRVVFNIAGNNFRMICKYEFGIHRVHLYVKWIGNHRDYSRLCEENKQYSINIY